MRRSSSSWWWAGWWVLVWYPHHHIRWCDLSFWWCLNQDHIWIRGERGIWWWWKRNKQHEMRFELNQGSLLLSSYSHLILILYNLYPASQHLLHRHSSDHDDFILPFIPSTFSHLIFIFSSLINMLLVFHEKRWREEEEWRRERGLRWEPFEWLVQMK